MPTNRKPRKLSRERLRQAVTQLLEESLPLPEINGKFLTRPHDDHDGDPSQVLHVGMLSDGDIVIRTCGYLRFRNLIGGGASPHTHNALRLLMLAVMIDEGLITKRP